MNPLDEAFRTRTRVAWQRQWASMAASVLLVYIAVGPSSDAAPVAAQPSHAAIAARVDDTPPLVRSTPDALVYGHATNAYLQIIAAGLLDGDDMADLVVGELPPGTGGGERTESNVLLGRREWPERAGTESLSLRKIVEPVQGERDSFAVLGTGDLDGDGRDDLITVALTQAGRPGQSVRLGLHWSPETWPSRPNLTRPDVTMDAPSDDVPHAAAAADVNGDGRADLVVSGERGVDIVFGRRPWPNRLPLVPPDVHIDPGPATLSFGDANGDGTADLWATFDAPALDAALVLGRATWPPSLNASDDGDVRIGSGRRDLSGAIVPDVSGDRLTDVMLIDHAAAAFDIYTGGPDVVNRITARAADWSATGISDTWGIAAMDLTGDGVAEVLVDRHAVFVGRSSRRGTFDVPQGAYDADWRGLGQGTLWSQDVDGHGGDDVLVSDSSASVRGRPGAGSIQIFLSPLFTPAPMPSAVPSRTATPTPARPSTATPTRTAVESPMPGLTSTPGPGAAGNSAWLPLACRAHTLDHG